MERDIQIAIRQNTRKLSIRHEASEPYVFLQPEPSNCRYKRFPFGTVTNHCDEAVPSAPLQNRYSLEQNIDFIFDFKGSGTNDRDRIGQSAF